MRFQWRMSCILALCACHEEGTTALNIETRWRPRASARDSSTISRSHLFKQTIQSTAAVFICRCLFPASSAEAMMIDPKTGIALPSPGEIEAAIPSDWTGMDNPLNGDKSQFARLDSAPDSMFYAEPRFVEHVDDNAVKLMTNYISKDAIQPNDTVLDLCSSWTSHIDATVVQPKTVVGLGMNEKELKSNAVLTSWNVQDLNVDPKLPYADNSFSVVLCQLGIDYLTRPLEVLKEVGRVLQPGGTVHILFSNRLFLSKAVGIWTGADDIDHTYIVGCYLHFCNGKFYHIQAKDLSTRQGWEKRIVGDPLYVVMAMKS